MTTWIFWRLTNRGGDYSALHAKKPGASYETLCGRRYDPYNYRMADELPEGYPRCKRCEARLPEPNGTRPPASVYCSGCGLSFYPATRKGDICPSCGASIAPEDVLTSPPDPAPTPGRRCPYFGKDVPKGFSGCAECGVKVECFDAWDQATRIFYKFNGPEIELAFVRWTPRFLIVKYPENSERLGDWRMGRNLVNRWLKAGVLRIEGRVPDWALLV